MPNITRGFVLSLSIGFAALLGGCASTADFKAPIDAFAEAAKASQTTLQTYDQAMDAAILKRNMAMALSGQGSVKPVTKDCRLYSERCRIVLDVTLDGRTQQLALDSEPADPIGRRIMAGIVDYAANLQAIAAIDTQAGVKSATDTTLANIKLFAGDIDTAIEETGGSSALKATVDRYATPVGDAFAFVLGNVLEAEKLRALRTSTQAMDAILPKLIAVCEASVSAGSNPERERLYNTYNAAVLDYAKVPTSAVKLDALRSASTAYDRVLAGNPILALEDLKKAHAALTDALRQDKPDFVTALAAIQKALDTALKAKAIIGEFEVAAHPK